ncbi:hypothetical protein ACLB2K_048416 [Fragaria x ananassa]
MGMSISFVVLNKHVLDGEEFGCQQSDTISRRRNFRDYMARHLTSLGIPKYAQPDILWTIVEAVDVALPGVLISVIVVDLDHSDTDQQMVIADDQLRVITHLWCSHLYHRACIVGWLEKSHSVPCANILWNKIRPTKSSWTQHWPMLLMVSAGGVITATLVCRYWKRSQ